MRIASAYAFVFFRRVCVFYLNPNKPRPTIHDGKEKNFKFSAHYVCLMIMWKIQICLILGSRSFTRVYLCRHWDDTVVKGEKINLRYLISKQLVKEFIHIALMKYKDLVKNHYNSLGKTTFEDSGIMLSRKFNL